MSARPARGTSSASNVGELLADLRIRFATASSATVSAERAYRIARREVLVRSVGPMGEMVDRALAPLRSRGSSAPDVIIHVWDTESTGTPLSPPPWTIDDYEPGGRIRGFADPECPVAFDLPTGTLNVYDARAREAFCWTSMATRIPSWFRRSPLRLVFGWWARSSGLALVHSGAVGAADGVVLITGAGSAGKSTTVFSARRAGLQVLSDDLCLVEPGSSAHASATVHALYGTAKVEPDCFDRLPELEAETVEMPDGRVVALGEGLLREGSLQAVLAVEIHDAPTEIESTSPAACLLALAPSSILGATAAEPDTLATMAEVVRDAPCYVIRVGPDPDDVAAAVRDLLRGTP